MRLGTVIYAKKVFFLRTILSMDKHSIYRKLSVSRLEKFLDNTEVSIVNKFYGPLYDIFRVTLMFGMMDMALRWHMAHMFIVRIHGE